MKTYTIIHSDIHGELSRRVVRANFSGAMDIARKIVAHNNKMLKIDLVNWIEIFNSNNVYEFFSYLGENGLIK